MTHLRCHAITSSRHRGTDNVEVERKIAVVETRSGLCESGPAVCECMRVCVHVRGCVRATQEGEAFVRTNRRTSVRTNASVRSLVVTSFIVCLSTDRPTDRIYATGWPIDRVPVRPAKRAELSRSPFSRARFRHSLGWLRAVHRLLAAAGLRRFQSIGRSSIHSLLPKRARAQVRAAAAAAAAAADGTGMAGCLGSRSDDARERKTYRHRAVSARSAASSGTACPT